MKSGPLTAVLLCWTVVRGPALLDFADPGGLTITDFRKRWAVSFSKCSAVGNWNFCDEAKKHFSIKEILSKNMFLDICGWQRIFVHWEKRRTAASAFD